MKVHYFLFLLIISPFSCNQVIEQKDELITISVTEYKDKLKGFWLGQCIANMTGLVTEMDKIGDIGDIKTGSFYTSEDWGKLDQPSIFSPDKPSDLSKTIDFVFEQEGVWPADDDTDLEYMYQNLLLENNTPFLSPSQIRDGWIKHIRGEEENFLWVSNQKAFDLMIQGIIPPGTSNPELNPYYEMIDAQLTTEIFGLFSPTKPEIALELAYFPIRTTARKNAALIAEFNIIMYSLASKNINDLSIKNRILLMAEKARFHLPNNTYPAKMFDFVYDNYKKGIAWESTRDELHNKYQVRQEDGYHWATTDKSCNGCFAAGINFGASIISLLYGEGDLKKTIQIGALAGWDSDNPTATWGGLLGFMKGKKEVEKIFGRKLSSLFNIHRTRKGFSNKGIDNFKNMAFKGREIVDRVVKEKMGGEINLEKDIWIIPDD